MNMMSLSLYRAATYAGYPLIAAYLAYRKAKGKEDLERFPERLGYSSKPRPEGRLVWIHGASVGETLSILPLVSALLETYPDVSVLVTSGTVTSANLMEKRLPARAFHQYIPVDCVSCVKRFVDHWKPDLALWIESEFWPNMLSAVAEAKIPLILLNGRISDRSFARWKKMPKFSGQIQALFTESFGQTEADADRLKILGAKKTACVGNLKFAASDLPYDAEEFKRLSAKIGARPCWIAASTHAGEDEPVAYAHTELRKKIPDVFTILAPRHPQRADEIEGVLKSWDLNVSRRSRGDEITDQTDVYLADTIGEMGLFYRLASAAFVGGSLIQFGGQNIIEPAKLGKAVLCGPYMMNFKEITARAKAADALTVVENKEQLVQALETLLTNQEELEAKQKNALAFATAESNVLERVMSALEPYLKPAEEVKDAD